MSDEKHRIDLTKSVGPALQEEISTVNKAVIDLLMTAARLGDSEPLAPALLGISREFLDELAIPGGGNLLKANFHGLPLVELRIKDPGKLRTILSTGCGGVDAIAEITKLMPLELIIRQ